jgi:hypothetical protein
MVHVQNQNNTPHPPHKKKHTTNKSNRWPRPLAQPADDVGDAGEPQNVLEDGRVLHDGDGGGEEVAEEVDEPEDLQDQADERPSVGVVQLGGPG